MIKPNLGGEAGPTRYDKDGRSILRMPSYKAAARGGWEFRMLGACVNT